MVGDAERDRGDEDGSPNPSFLTSRGVQRHLRGTKRKDSPKLSWEPVGKGMDSLLQGSLQPAREASFPHASTCQIPLETMCGSEWLCDLGDVGQSLRLTRSTLESR